MEAFVLYLVSLLTAWLVSFLALPLLRRYAGPYLTDTPGGLKKHTGAVPAVGGCGILLGVLGSLVLIRLGTHFPSGTLHNLRGIFIGGMLIFTMGLADDLTKPRGLPVWIKLVFQAAATAALIRYDVVIHFLPVRWLAWPLTFLWVVGLTNAFNLLDIKDGLCTTQALVCTLGLTLVSLPQEYVYVNFASLSLLGACLAFWPYNQARTRRTFLGDSGSNLLGFLLAALSLGYGYSGHSNWGFLAPLLILGVPLFDTAFVSLARLIKGKNPLLGSDDHAALRLERAGWSNKRIVVAFSAAGLLSNLAAFILTRSSAVGALALLATAALAAGALAWKLLRLERSV